MTLERFLLVARGLDEHEASELLASLACPERREYTLAGKISGARLDVELVESWRLTG